MAIAATEKPLSRSPREYRSYEVDRRHAAGDSCLLYQCEQRARSRQHNSGFHELNSLLTAGS